MEYDENKLRGTCDHRSCSRVGRPLCYPRLATSPSSQSLLYSDSLKIHETIAKIDPGLLEDDLPTNDAYHMFIVRIRDCKGRVTVDEVAIFLQS